VADTCDCQPADILIFPCAGGSNCGQIANQAAVELTKQAIGRIFCLAGIGGHVESMLESAKEAKRVVVIDGCPVGCAKKIMEHANFKVTDYTLVTELGIKKNHDFNLPADDIEKVCSDVKKKLGVL